MENELALQILAEDRSIIAYRPKLAQFVGSVTAAILLQQIFYRFSQSKNEPFYKFREACNSELYRAGDSWTEELGYSAKQLDAALGVIGTKIEKGVKKQEVMTHKFEGDSFPKTSLPYLVVYWTDSSRVTWYWLNRELLGKCLKCIYLGNSPKVNYLVIHQTAITSIPENTTENTTNISKVRARNDKRKTPVVSILRDVIYEAILEGWDLQDDGIVPRIRETLLTVLPNTDATGIKRFVKWYHLKNDGISLPIADEKLKTWYGRFLKETAPVAHYTNPENAKLAREIADAKRKA